MGTYKIEPNIQKYSCVNFPACIQLASDWFKNNQVLSDSPTHNNREPVPLKSSNTQEVALAGVGVGVLDGEVSN